MTDLICAIIAFLVVFIIWGILNFAEVQDRTWKTGLIIGAVGFGFAGVGCLAPAVNPFPFLTSLVGAAGMLGFVLYFYYKKQEKKDREAAALLEYERSKTRFLVEILSGLAVVMFAAIFASFTLSQNRGITIQSAYESAISQLTHEIGEIRKDFSVVQKDVKILKDKQAAEAKADSLRAIQRAKDASIIIKQTKRK